MQLTHLGPYEINKPLGRGGMGSVYAATDPQTGMRVAIKALSPHLAMAEGFRERFEAEIESLKTLRHEGIVRLYGYGEQDGVLFYSMELVEGISLEDELKAGRRFNWREVTNIAIQLSLALKHAHDHGIVHRDIKPANILLYDEERVKLADFGIARLFGTTQLTTAGGVLGTADYMSPEQAEGRPVTARCDQYSLGGVMYALLAGRPPFLAKGLPQMLQLQRFADPEPVRRYAPDTPQQLERVILQLLSKDPADRFPNTQVLARHLQAMVQALSRPAADDFALASDPRSPGNDDLAISRSLDLNPTQARENATLPAESIGAPVNKDKSRRLVATQDAATMAADEAGSSIPPAARSASAAPAIDGAAQRAAERQAHFTTIEEEEARRRAEGQRSWLLVAAQLAALAAVLIGMGGVVLYMLRPPTADELYKNISSEVKTDDDSSLAISEAKIDEFLRRFPNDPRAAELQQHKGTINLDKFERQLQRQTRTVSGAGTAMLPVEQLYLRAVDLTAIVPDEAAATLQSLIDLYKPVVADKADSQVAAVVQLAERRLADLRANLARQHELELTSLRERLAAAAKIEEKDSQQAASMYRAIIQLHGKDAWANDVVIESRIRLEKLGEGTP